MVRDLLLPILELRGRGVWYNAVNYVIPVTQSTATYWPSRGDHFLWY